MASIRQRNGRWQARVRRQGFPVETKSFTSKAEAERWARSMETEMDRGAYCNRSVAESMTLGDLLKKYTEEVSPNKRGGKEEVIRLNAMRRHRMCQLSMANLTSKAVAEYRDERQKTCGPNTIIRDLAMLSSAINHARKEWGVMVVNPVALVRKPATPQGRDRVLDDEEETRLVAALAPQGRRNIYMRPLAIVALESAMRRGELLALRWQDVDLHRRVAFLPLTKNGRARTVPLSLRAIAILEAMPRSIGGQVFPITSAAMEAAFKKATKRAGLHGLHFHDLRHTATTRLATKLDNVLELSAVTGHTDLRMLKRYYHPKAEDLARKIG
ncbi:MAG: site-specific integrase [Gammaproteobacteria bacterium]|nr:site-specific integrase [Gammaproteobacteria bacterium]MBI5618143.1 site-specific integrase [Gammaproteobacteria bacterium]